jgi:hypothetical protein
MLDMENRILCIAKIHAVKRMESPRLGRTWWVNVAQWLHRTIRAMHAAVSPSALGRGSALLSTRHLSLHVSQIIFDVV